MARRATTGAAEAEAYAELRFHDRLAAGDAKGAAAVALRAHGPDLLRYLRWLLVREADAQEAFSGACERLWRSLPAFRGEVPLKVWCLKLAWSAAADLKKEAWRARGRRLETGEAEARATSAQTASWLRRERLHLSLADLRRALPPEDQSLLQLRIDQGLSWSECAAVLSATGRAPSAEALAKRFERIKARLRELAAEEDAS